MGQILERNSNRNPKGKIKRLRNLKNFKYSKITQQVANWITFKDLLHDSYVFGQDCRVGILDTGYDLNNDVLNTVIDTDCSIDLTGEGLNDQNSHGTTISLLIASIAPKAKQIHIKIFNKKGRINGNSDEQKKLIIKAVRHAVSSGCRVINISGGVIRWVREDSLARNNTCCREYCECRYCLEIGEIIKKHKVSLVAASGNIEYRRGFLPIVFPSSAPGVIAVAEITPDQRVHNTLIPHRKYLTQGIFPDIAQKPQYLGYRNKNILVKETRQGRYIIPNHLSYRYGNLLAEQIEAVESRPGSAGVIRKFLDINKRRILYMGSSYRGSSFSAALVSGLIILIESFYGGNLQDGEELTTLIQGNMFYESYGEKQGFRFDIRGFFLEFEAEKINEYSVSVSNFVILNHAANIAYKEGNYRFSFLVSEIAARYGWTFLKDKIDFITILDILRMSIKATELLYPDIVGDYKKLISEKSEQLLKICKYALEIIEEIEQFPSVDPRIFEVYKKEFNSVLNEYEPLYLGYFSKRSRAGHDIKISIS